MSEVVLVRAIGLNILLVNFIFSLSARADWINQRVDLYSSLPQSLLQKSILPRIIDSLETLLQSQYHCRKVTVHIAFPQKNGSRFSLDVHALCPPSVRHLILGFRGLSPKPSEKNPVGMNVIIFDQKLRQYPHPIDLWSFR
ncbi:MAG: hypothetical protein KDD35_07415 [Bdellovibrionales bacterium]|nr:hypothetical protein [Bdellovibrionales bacterium]